MKDITFIKMWNIARYRLFIKAVLLVILTTIIFSFKNDENTVEWIRINQLGYTPAGLKVALWCSKADTKIISFELVDTATGKIVVTQDAGRSYVAYVPFTNTCRLNFSNFKQPGVYILPPGSH